MTEARPLIVPHRVGVDPDFRLGPIRWVVCVQHLIWAVILIGWPDSVDITALDTHLKLNPEPASVAALFILSSALVLLSPILNRRGARWLGLMLPQQWLVCVTAVGALHSMWIGEDADGTIRPTVFIVADQSIRVLLAVAHTYLIGHFYFQAFRGRR